MPTSITPWRAGLLGVGIATAAVLGAAQPAAPQSYPAKPPVSVNELPAATPGRAEIFITTVHLDGNTTQQGDAAHPAEPFPAVSVPAGGGLQLTPPDAQGKWRIRTFVFQPAQVIVPAGTVVGLNFVGVQGPSHRIAVEGVEEVIELRRGEVKRIEVATTKPGTIRFASLDRLPSMQGEVLVLPAPP